jgi:hypothetical protein
MRLRNFLTTALIAFVVVAGCRQDNDTNQPSRSTGMPAAVTGPIIDIESEDTDHVRAFTVRSGEQTYEILIDPNVDYGFPLGHLEEHRTSGAPVRVDLDERDGDLYALAIVDA